MKKKKIAVPILIVAFILVGWTVWGNVTVGVTRYRVSGRNLPKAFHGYKIAVVSDFHNADYFGKGNQQIIEKIEKESPDMIAITGDLVDSRRTDIEAAAALLHELMKTAPCYYVPGNHEARIGRQFSELEERLLAENVVILHDRVIPLEKDGQMIQLAGLDDPAFTDRDAAVQQSMLQTKLHQMKLTEEYCVLLSHHPETFEAYAEEGVDLVLSGHAHGGQVRLPLIGGLVAPDQGFFPKYDAGIYTQKDTTMIVSRGIGNSIIPVRLNNRPEIVVVELVGE